MDQPSYANDAFVTSMRGDGMRAPSPVRVRGPPSVLGPLPPAVARSDTTAPPLPPPPRVHRQQLGQPATGWLPRRVKGQLDACLPPVRDAAIVFAISVLLLLAVRPPFVCTRRNGVTKGTLSYPRVAAYSGVAVAGALWLRQSVL